MKPPLLWFSTRHLVAVWFQIPLLFLSMNHMPLVFRGLFHPTEMELTTSCTFAEVISPTSNLWFITAMDSRFSEPIINAKGGTELSTGGTWTQGYLDLHSKFNRPMEAETW